MKVSANRVAGVTAFVGAMLVSVSMGAAAGPSSVMNKPAEVTADGLHRVDSPVLALAWFKPGVDFRRYTKIMFTPDGVTFNGAIKRANGEFAVSADQQERFSAMLLEVFTDELGKLKHFTVVTEPGPDVLRVRGAVLDVVSNIPPQSSGRGKTIQSAIGEATLVVELQDSVTEEFLARGVDRRKATSIHPRLSNSVNNGAELRTVARQWATELRERLDEL